MSALSPADRSKLARVLGLLGSNHAGERDAAALAAHRIVQGAGISWAEALAHNPAPPRVAWNTASADLQLCLKRQVDLSAWEGEFIRGLTSSLRWSNRQRTKLSEIAAELRMRDPT